MADHEALAEEASINLNTLIMKLAYFREMEWDQWDVGTWLISWQLRGQRGIYGGVFSSLQVSHLGPITAMCTP